MSAMTVFSECIRYLRRHLVLQIAKTVTSVSESDIKWVITVPAIWNDKAKRFMREAAELVSEPCLYEVDDKKISNAN